MLFKQSSYGDEKIFATYKNVEASSLTTGMAVALATAAASFNGTNVCMAGTAAVGRQQTWLGFAAQDLAPNAYGLVQMYGLVNSIYISNYGISVTFTLGDSLVPGALAGGVGSIAAPTFATSGFAGAIVISAPLTLSAISWTSGFFRHGL